MKIRPISEWTLYRLRFVLAYGFVVVTTGLLLALYLNMVPPGISQNEQQSVITSANLSFTQLPTAIVDLPYHALQKLSVDFFGVTPLGVRLPSLIFAGLTALCIIGVLRRWFKGNIAVAGCVLILVSAWYLGMARLGTPLIMIPFWTSLLLMSATYVSQQTKGWGAWRVLFVLAAALSLYTPYMTYLFVAALIASFAQPHLRYLIREGSKINLVIGGFFFLLLLAPLGWGLYQNLGQAKELLAIPNAIPDALQFGTNLWTAISNFVNPYNVTTGEMITPVIGLVTASLGVIGAARLFRDMHSVRAHVLFIWAAILVPVIGFNPTNFAVLFVPTLLVVTIGLNQIIRYWYRLFPRNPYARLFGLLPLAVLLLSIV